MLDPVHIDALTKGGWTDLPFAPFRPGIDISWLQKGEPGIAVLRYQAGAEVPLHAHPDTETILVLEGSQSDDRGTYQAGDLVINPKGSQHRVWSDYGCVVLLCWTKPVV
ncbi:MAG: cupin domain-containing protein, partial [Pseudomonadota bacterium]